MLFRSSLQDFSILLPEDSLIFADAAYTSYHFEDLLSEAAGIKLLAKRRKNLKRQHSLTEEHLISIHRNSIETVFSSIVSRMPRTIRARTEKGVLFEGLFLYFGLYVEHFFSVSLIVPQRFFSNSSATLRSSHSSK